MATIFLASKQKGVKLRIMNNQKPVNTKTENKDIKCPPKENKAENKVTKQQKNGLYSALAVCLVSVAAAALVTYMGFSEFNNETALEVNSKSESVVTKAEGSDDPLIDGKRKNESTPGNSVSKSEEAMPESLLSEHEGDGEVKAPEEKATDAAIKKDDNIITELIKETAAAETDDIFGNIAPPLDNLEISKKYSSDLIYNETMRDYRSHNGIDFIASLGNEVRSVTAGKVKDVYKDLLLGNVVEAEHGGYIVRYCGLNDDIKVRPGDVLSKSTVIGTVGEIPFEKNDGTHFHIEVKKDGLYIDPAELLK